MEFEFTPEQVQLRKSNRDFEEADIGPHVLEWDENQTFPLEVIKNAGKLGLMGAIFPEDLGGAGCGYIEYSIIIEELARVDPSVALIVAAHNSLCTNHIYLAGTDEQKRTYVPRLATGEWIGCWSLTEPEAGSDAGGTRSKAVKTGGCWVLNGGKTFTTMPSPHVAVRLRSGGRGRWPGATRWTAPMRSTPRATSLATTRHCWMQSEYIVPRWIWRPARARRSIGP